MNVSAASHSAVEGVAGDWFARRESGEWTPEDQVSFDQWLEASPLHRVAYLRIENAWERAGRLKALSPGRSTEVPAPGSWVLSPFFEQDPVKGARTRPWAGLAVAACVVAALIVAVIWTLQPGGQIFSTPVGGLETVTLADGSVLTLNTDSSVRVTFRPHERRIELRRGEAFFEVAKNPNRPFVVLAGDQRVIAVGTQFSVWRESHEGDVQVVVTEGTVRMESRSVVANPAETAGHGNPVAVPVLLPAGTIARVSGTNVLLQRASGPAAEETLSWRRGVIVFHDVTLAEAAAEFNRYNNRQIVIAEPGVAALTVAGSFRATNVDAFLRLVEKGYPVRSEVRDDQVVLSGR